MEKTKKFLLQESELPTNGTTLWQKCPINRSQCCIPAQDSL